MSHKGTESEINKASAACAAARARAEKEIKATRPHSAERAKAYESNRNRLRDALALLKFELGFSDYAAAEDEAADFMLTLDDPDMWSNATNEQDRP